MDSSLGNQFIKSPIFRPTEEQFKCGPASYIRGITKSHPNLPCCVIVPPQSFNPYFSLDQDTFRFKTIKQDFLSNDDVPAEKEFSFREYHRMGDSFKSDYFGKPPNMVPLEDIDENFWSLVSQGEDVQIFSAYCLSSKVHGSGFPNRNSGSFLTKEDEKYLDHPWNLLNITESDENTFSALEPQVGENTVPTLDIGMCFSHRGWRRDIHWSYSINYLHCGDSKLWYAVSPDDTKLFESKIYSGSIPLPIELVRETAKSQNLSDERSKLGKSKVKVFKAELHPGHFFVTFPSVYYMSYDTGVNVVESVVIAPVDWLPIGYKAIEYFCDNKQSPLFSHEELVSKYAVDAESLDIDTLKEILINFEHIIQQELISRKVIDDYSSSIKHQRQAFELIPENDRRCSVCGYIVFFSAFTCDCDTHRFVCLKHVNNLCEKCPTSAKIFRFRYAKNEFEMIIKDMKKRIYDYEKWKKEIDNLLHGWTNQVSVEVLRRLLDEAEDNNYPQECHEFEKLCNALQEFEQVDKIVQELIEQQNKFTEEENQKRVKYQSSLAQSSARIKKKMETEKDENKHGSNSVKSKFLQTRNIDSDGENRKLSVTEFSGFCEVLDTYPFHISGSDELKKILLRCNEIDKSIDGVFDVNITDKIDSNKLESLIQDANSISFICFDRKLEALKEKLIEVKWLEDCAPVLDHDDPDDEESPQHDLNELKSLIESGMNLKSHSNIVKSYLNRLSIIYEEADRWLDNAKDILNTIKQNNLSSLNGEKLFLENIERLMNQSRENPGLRAVDLNPSRQQLEEILSKCQDWLKKADSLMISLRLEGVTKEDEEEDIPYASQLEDLYNQGKTIGFHFDVLNAMKGSLEIVNDWKEKVNKNFLRRNSLYPIVNILAPRSNYALPSSIDIMNCSSRSTYQQLKKYATLYFSRDGIKKLTGFEKQLGGDFSSEKIKQIYIQAESEEESEIQIIREKNIKKNNQIANNESTLGDDDAGNTSNINNDFNEKDGKSKERDKHLKKFCFCGKPASEWMVQCQLCQEWYHITCVSSYLPFVNLVAKGRKQLVLQNTEDVVDQFNFVCLLCCRGKRPSLDYIQDLIYSYSKLPTRVLEGELLVCLLRRVQKYQEKVKAKIASHSDLMEGFEIAERNYCFQSESCNQETNITDSPSKNKRKSPLILRKDLTDNPGIALSNESHTVLWDLICQGNLLEANVPELHHLWTVMLIVNKNLKTLVFVNSNSTSLSILASNTFMIGTNKRTPESDDGNEGESLEPDSTKSKMKRRRRDRGSFERNIRRKSRKLKNDKDAAVDVEPELCSLNNDCLRPEGQEVDWIFCEGRCQRWFHQLCAGISNPQEVIHLEKYICATCQSLDDVESNKATGNHLKENNHRQSSKSGRTSRTCVKSHVNTASANVSISSKEDCEQGRANELSNVSKEANLILSEIEVDQMTESNPNSSLDFRSIPRVIADDEETTSCLSEDLVYHDSSFESVEENVAENETGDGHNVIVNDGEDRKSSQVEDSIKSEQSIVTEEVSDVAETLAKEKFACLDEGETTVGEKMDIVVCSKESDDNIEIFDENISELGSNAVVSKEEPEVETAEVSIEDQTKNELVNLKESPVPSTSQPFDAE